MTRVAEYKLLLYIKTRVNYTHIIMRVLQIIILGYLIVFNSIGVHSDCFQHVVSGMELLDLFQFRIEDTNHPIDPVKIIIYL